LRAIRNETQHAKDGKKGRIIAKMNALLDPETIDALYDASRAGVQIDLIVRGMCALKAGTPGVSENIRVRSVVGRFLEHSRVFYFHNDGAEDVYLSSADWMERNFFRRVEICFPILDPQLKKRVINEGLTPYLEDSGQAWTMGPDGDYHVESPRQGEGVAAQESLLKLLAQHASA
jgi:polyphosphate kinase